MSVEVQHTFTESTGELDLSIVVPVYGGSAAIPELCERVAKALDATGIRYEIIFVDDRGSPAAWGAIVAATNQYAKVRGLRLSRNFGQHSATICGLSHARGTWIVTMDDDLEHPPEAITSMLAAGSRERPLVYGVFPRRTHVWYRNITSELMRWALKRAFPDMNESYSSFRCMHYSIARQVCSFNFSRPYIDGMLSWITSSVGNVSVEHGSRAHGESAYTFKKLISHALNIFITFSNLPLRVATWSGVILALISFVSILSILYGKLTGLIANPGYASMMSVILFACGIQLTILGLLGEYVGRLMGAAHHKPVFVVIEKQMSSRV